MTFQAYLDNIKAKTGRTPEDFRAMAKKKGLAKAGEIIAWLAADYGLGRGHAMAIVHVIQSHDQPEVPLEDQIAAYFTGRKVKWRKTFDALMLKLHTFGPDVKLSPTST